jgi:TRAP transporter TAXI family solute receptor
VLSLSLGAASPSHAETIGIATSGPGTVFNSIGTAIAKAANDAGMATTIQPATSPNQYLYAVNSGDIAFGVSNLQEFEYALAGEGWFAGRPNPSLRIVGFIMPITEAIFVRKDSDIQTIADLKGKPMVDGFTAQETILPQLDAQYASAGLTRADMQPVQVPSIVAGADAFIAGDSVGFIFAQGAGKVREADAAVGGLRALSLSNSPATVAAIKSHWPTGYLAEVKPGPTSPGVLRDGWFVAYPQIVFTNASVPDSVVARLAEVIHDSKPSLVSTFAPFKDFDRKAMAGGAPATAFHPGAIAYFKKIGIWNR